MNIFNKLFFSLDSIQGDICTGLDYIKSLERKIEGFYNFICNKIDFSTNKIGEVHKEIIAIASKQQRYYGDTSIEIEDSKNDILDEIREHKNLTTMEYEDISKLSKLPKQYEELCGMIKSYLIAIDKWQERVERGLPEYGDYNAKKAELESLRKQNDALVVENLELRSIISSLEASLAMVCQGLYDHEHIEFAAVKTYRGWQYLCYNGRQITNFDDIEDMRIDYTKGENLNMDISFNGN